jgi:hypothetical protein
MSRQAGLSAATHIVALALLLFPVRAWGWGYQGHRIVAVIAADNLTPAAQSHVANILGVPADQRAVASAMETASIQPDDSRFREQNPSTRPWHFINICLRDTRADIRKRCAGGNCVTDKIDEYSKRLKEGNYDRWGAAGDLAFLIHFVGDIHQPLHAANDADEGGNCIKVDSRPRADSLHDAWDNAIVRRLENSIDSGRPETTAHRLEQTYAREKALDVWIPGHTDDIAWESNQIARSDIYTALHIPVEPCESDVLCSNRPQVDLNSAYMDHAELVAGHQLAKAGFRLASLLNGIWLQPDGRNNVPGAANSAPAQVLSSKAVASQIVGNRRSKIYAWPGCGSYDTMAPQNRVMFPSRNAAEQAGYRAAYNCP